MRTRPYLTLAAVATLFFLSAPAMNPEDIVGIISDTVVPDPEICRSLCGQNPGCYSLVYHFECDECWQLDCVTRLVYFGADTWTKPSNAMRYTCPTDLVPVLPEDCGNLTATATVTSVDDAAATGGGDEDGEEDAANLTHVSWAALCLNAVAIMLFAI